MRTDKLSVHLCSETRDGYRKRQLTFSFYIQDVNYCADNYKFRRSHAKDQKSRCIKFI